MGSNEAFLFSLRADRLFQLGSEAARHVAQPRDPGGRLGPMLARGQPDLRNKDTCWGICEAGDLLLICSDGYTHNLSPEICGMSTC